MYDYLIVGSGLFGATFAHLANEIGKSVLVIDKRQHIAGNVFTKNRDGIDVHKYGAHIFHTSDESIWKFITQFGEFVPYTHSAKVSHNNLIYDFPINLNTIQNFYPNISTSTDARLLLDSFKSEKEIKNFEDFVISNVGEKLYRTFYYGYTKKQWGMEPSELPAFIAKRIPIRIDNNTDYFDDTYQGIPKYGYTPLIEKMLSGIEVRLNTDYLDNLEYFNSISDKIVFTGQIDSFFNYRFGELDYRSLRFEEEVRSVKQFQVRAIVNYAELCVPYTRIVEHKHFNDRGTDFTIITKEYSEINKDKYYPINNKRNNDIYSKYLELSKEKTNVIFGGRLAEYKYYDMHQVIASAQTKFKRDTLKN